MSFQPRHLGPLDHVLADLPKDRKELIYMGKQLRDRVQAARSKNERPNMTDVEKLLGVMHRLKRIEEGLPI